MEAKMRVLIILLCGFGAWLAFCGSPVSAAEKGTMTKEEFLKQYLPAAERLKDYYRHVTIHATSSKLDWPVYKDRGGGDQILKVVFRSNGPFIRLDSTELVDGKTKGMPIIYVDTPDQSFSAYPRLSPDKTYIYHYRDHKKDVDNESGSQQLGLVENIRLLGMADIPLAYFEIALPDLFTGKLGTKIDKIETDEISGEKVVSVLSHYLCGPKEDRSNRYARFEFLPEKNWALRFSAVFLLDKSGEPGRDILCKKLTYEGMDGDIPLIKKMVDWRNEPDGKKKYRWVIDINSLKVESTPESEFTPDILGDYELYREYEEEKLQKVPYLMWPEWNYGRLFLILIGATMLGVGLMLKYRQYRRAAGETNE
jgi:hypothetical protein